MFIINHVPIKKYADCEQATQTTPAPKNVCPMSATLCLAKEMGALLG
ncbi:hypothetical protein HACA111877_07765 [Halomonas casei]